MVKFPVTDPWNEIIPNLWVGSADQSPTCEDFDLVVTCYDSSPDVGFSVREYEFFFNDGRLPDLKLLSDAVAAVWRAHMSGERVLVRCFQGLNRSALVVGLTLCLLGYTPRDAINLIRINRSPDCLFNPKFEAYLLCQ